MTMSEQSEYPINNPDAVELRLIAAGFNAHRQIHVRDGDVPEFSTVLSYNATSPYHVLFAGWSDTVIAGSRSLLSIGSQRIEPRVAGGDASAENLRSGFGDHDGMIGCLDDQGRLYLVEPSQRPTEVDQGICTPSICEERGVVFDHRLTCRSTEASPLIGLIAQAQNGRIALTFKQAPEGRLCHLVEFDTFETFQKWFLDPSGEENYPKNHSMLPGRPKQLSASTANFILLMESGEVYTWGDARYESLARSVSGENAIPADRPGLVGALGGLKIVSVSTGGWISAALSEDGALYVWGTISPGSEGFINCISTTEDTGVSLVDIFGPDTEPLDINDVAVGENHILAVSEGGGPIFAVGDNRNGQLGLGTEHGFVQNWQQVTNVRGASSVSAGPKTSWAVVKHLA